MDAVIERISAEQFVATLEPEEHLYVLVRSLDYTQEQIAQIFGVSPPTVSRVFRRIHAKYAAWNR